MKLDPKSADVPAELAGLYARQSRARESHRLWKAALALNADHGEANRVLGSVYRELCRTRPEQRRAGIGPGGLPPAGPRAPRAIAQDLESRHGGRRALDDRQAVQCRDRRSTRRSRCCGNCWPMNRGCRRGWRCWRRPIPSRDRPGNAIALLQDAVAVEPAFYETLASACEKDNRWSDAARAYEQALGRDARATCRSRTRWAFAWAERSGQRGCDACTRPSARGDQGQPDRGMAALPARPCRARDRDLDASEAAARRLLAISPGSTSGAHALARCSKPGASGELSSRPSSPSRRNRRGAAMATRRSS